MSVRAERERERERERYPPSKNATRERGVLVASTLSQVRVSERGRVERTHKCHMAEQADAKRDEAGSISDANWYL